jgi:hypothetical protein
VAVVVGEPVHSHPPREAGLRRGQVRVRHDDALGAAARHALHARILVRVHVVRGTGGKHLLELVAAPVARREHEHVRDVVEEAVARAVAAPVAGAYAAGDSVRPAVRPLVAKRLTRTREPEVRPV